MSRRKRSRDVGGGGGGGSDGVEMAYVGCDMRDRGFTLRGIRIPGQHRLTVFLPHGKVRHVEEIADKDVMLNDKYMVHFQKPVDREEFLEKLEIAVEEYHVDDQPAISKRLDYMHTEMFRANKEMSDQLQLVADRLENIKDHMVTLMKKNGGPTTSGGEAATASGKGSAKNGGKKKKSGK